MNKNMLSIATIMLLTLGINGCGGSSDNTEKSSNEVKIDRAEYLPKSNETRSLIKIVEDSKKTDREKQNYSETIFRANNLITYETNNTTHTTITITDKGINTSRYLEEDTNETRHVALSGTISSEGSFFRKGVKLGGLSLTEERTTKAECILDKKLDTFEADSQLKITYGGNLIRKKCTTTIKQTFTTSDNNQSKTKNFETADIFYVYSEKNKGKVALINRDCYIVDKDYNFYNGKDRLDDNSKTCDKVVTTKNLLLE